jgi:hypothetical protein
MAMLGKIQFRSTILSGFNPVIQGRMDLLFRVRPRLVATSQVVSSIMATTVAQIGPEGSGNRGKTWVIRFHRAYHQVLRYRLIHRMLATYSMTNVTRSRELTMESAVQLKIPQTLQNAIKS